MKALLLPAFCLLALVSSSRQMTAQAQETGDQASTYMVYVGTYTNGSAGSQGIYRFEFDADKGTLKPVGKPTISTDPSFLAIHPSGKVLYACNETGTWDGHKNTGAISAYAIDPKTGDLRFLNRQLTRGGAPCHLWIDATGGSVHVANYSGGSVISYALGQDGRLGRETSFFQHTGSSVTPRQAAPHAHCINIDPSNRFAAVADLGLDKVLIYKLDAATGALAKHDPAFVKTAPAAGPRHFAFHPAKPFAYVINEMNSTVDAFDWNAKAGALMPKQTISTLPPEGFDGRTSTAEVFIHPNGKFLYGSNRGHNSIVAYAIDQQTGKLTLIGHQGEGIGVPRNFAIDPTGKFILAAGQSTNQITVHPIDPKTGAVGTPQGKVEVPVPVCIVLLPWPSK